MVNNKEVYIRFVKKMMNLLVIFSFLVILIQTFNDMSSFSNNNNRISSDTSELIDKEKSYKHSITAILYNTNRYADDGEGTKLTENGISVDNWVQNTSKYLQIDVDVHAYENEVHSVKIELPKELYIVGSINKLPAGYSDVKFKKNNDISVNGGADTYNINDHSGVLTYYLQPNVERASIQIELRYDEVLWDKMNNTSITPNNIAPVKVSINYHPDSNTSVKLNEVKINKITSGKKTSKQGYFYYSSPYDLLDRNTKDLDIVIDSTYNEISYYKEAIFEIQIPYYKDDYGNRYYLDYDINELFFNKVCFGGKVNYNILTANDSVIKIKVENALFSVRDINSPYLLITLPLTFPRELKVDSTFVKFSGGKFIVHGTSNNENKYIVLSSDIIDTTYANKDIEYVDVRWGCGGSVTFEKGAKNVVMMGGYYVENYGKKNSVPKTMHMTFPNKMLITSINILSDTTSMSRNITYSLIDSNGNPVYLDKNGNRVSAETKGAISSWVYKLNNINYKKEKYCNIFENFNRQLLPANQRKYYFSKVSYTVDTIRGGSKMYNDSALYAYNGTGNFYGVFRNDVKTSDTLITNIRISSPSSSVIADLNYTINTRPTLTRNSAYCIKNVSMSEDSIRAGESLDIIGNVCVVEYPYAENTILEKIKIGLILPKGVLIDGTSAINLTSSVGDKVNVASLTHNSINSTNNIWIISVDDSCRIGFAKETLGAIKTGDKLKFKIRLNTSQSLNALTLFSDEILLTAGEGISNNAYGTYTWTKAVDLYDLNNNGVTTDTIGKMNPPDRVQCTIIPDNPSLDITDYITVLGVGNSTGTSANLKCSADIATYNLSVKNNDNGVASKFEYYIPIPKKKFANDKYLLFSDDERAFNFKMIEKPTIVGNDIFEFQYSTQSNLTYYDVRGINESEWITQDDMDSKKYDWSQITMIKITAKSNNIQIGSNTLISIKLRYGDLDFNGNYGKMNKWRSSGYYDYRTSTKVYSGHYKTSGCTATINYGLEVFDEITINAIANTAPNKKRSYYY